MYRSPFVVWTAAAQGLSCVYCACTCAKYHGPDSGASYLIFLDELAKMIRKERGLFKERKAKNRRNTPW